MAKKDNKIIEDEMKKDAITMESSSSDYGFFDNKYVRAGLATALAVYASKKEPYMLQGFAEKMSEFEKYDRETRAKFIEAATASATTEIARNKLRRLERREKIAPEIKRAVENGMNPIIAGKAYKAGNLTTLLNLKMNKPNLDINSLYSISTEFTDNMGSFQANDVIEAIAGPTLKLDNAFNNLKAPRTISPIRNFLGGDDDGSAQKEIQQRIDSQTTSSDDYKSIDFSGVSLSDEGKRILEAAGAKQPITYTGAKSDLAKWTANIMKLGKNSVDLSGGDFVFQSDDANNNQYAGKITDKMISEAEALTKDTSSLAFNNRTIALDIVKKKYSMRNEDGTFSINIPKINAGEEDKLIPNEWTPAESTEKQIEKKKKKLIASVQITQFKGIIDSIKKDRGLTTRERNKAVELQIKIYRNKIKALMRETPPRATQADLDQIK